MRPGFTQVPNVVIDEWIKILSDVEFRIVLVVARQTYGWIEDTATGRRKEKDWISRSQLEQKTFRGKTSISMALKRLVDELGVVGAYNEAGDLLDTPQKRRACGNKIFYRINTNQRQESLFPTSSKFRQVKKRRGKTSKKLGGVQSLNTQSLDATKETVLTKENVILRPATPSAPKVKGDHTKFIEFWHDMVVKCREMKPMITGADARNLKRVLGKKIVTESQLEQMAVYFLGHRSFKKFAPNISTFLSGGIINGLMNRMANDQDFWKEVDSIARIYGGRAATDKDRANTEQLKRLKESFQPKQFVTDRQRSEIATEVAGEERRTK